MLEKKLYARDMSSPMALAFSGMLSCPEFYHTPHQLLCSVAVDAWIAHKVRALQHSKLSFNHACLHEVRKLSVHRRGMLVHILVEGMLGMPEIGGEKNAGQIVSCGCANELL
jgi:hypothetical protein